MSVHVTPLADIYERLSEAVANVRRQPSQKPDAQGRTFERYHSKAVSAGKHPFDDVKWDLRTAAISGSDGGVVFEQHDVEVPSDWSMLATNIVASKYFRGTPGTPSRETSVRDVIHRVASTVALWAAEDGYWADAESAISFYIEMCYLLLHQHFAFNSPVWFNLGTKEVPQASACYICSVDDSMESIMDLARVEAMIFKGGSGAGSNLSTLRSSKEHLTGGGLASGPVSFMRGYDAFAGVVKSGGKTRRAAKMTLLDCDHPDIVEFVNCKQLEEKKAWALIEQGYSPDFNGEAYGSIFFQNANLSVRASDAFMEAVEEDGQWPLRAVRTNEELGIKAGDPLETIRARDLMRMIADGTHICGDPGMQFDDTINHWHPCLDLGRQRATNPCCFVGETYVDTSEGRVRIDELARLSDSGSALPYAFGYDRDEELPALRAIKKAWVAGRTRELVEVTTDKGVVLRCTPEHRFLLRNGEYVEAQHLQAGMRLRKIGRGESGTQPRTTILHRCTEAAPNGTVYQSRFMWEQVHGAIPDDHHVHHRDENRRNDKLSNFALVEGTEHWQEHSTGEDNPRYIDADAAKLVEVYEAIEATPKKTRTDKAALVTPARWNRYIDDNGLNGVVPKAASPTRGGRIRGMTWAEFCAWVESQRSLVNDTVAGVVKISLEAEVPVYDIEVEGIRNFGVSSDADATTHSIVVHNSEYLWLDNTSCNLASINLLKYRRPKRQFDTAGFRSTVITVITAMEVLVDRASYPTPLITERSKLFRTLGIGYANLGALLMSFGLPYDSDEGRFCAAAITSLMTAAAYETSGEWAAAIGPFGAFEESRSSFTRVMGQHLEAAQTLQDRVTKAGMPVPDDLLGAGIAAWKAVQDHVAAHGVRNAQASVLAPTGCVTADTMLLTSEGLLPITELGDAQGPKWQDVHFSVAQEKQTESATKFYVNGRDRVYSVTTERGHQIRATWKHRLRVLADDGRYEWRRMEDLKAGDTLVTRLGGHESLLADKPYVQLQTEPAQDPRDERFTLPEVLDEQLAEVVGYYMGNGYTKEKGGLHFAVGDDHSSSLVVFDQWTQEIGGVVTSESRQGCVVASIHGRRLVRWWERNGFSKPKGNHGEGAAGAFIPTAVLRSRTSVLQAFLRGLFDADGTVSRQGSGTPVLELTTVSETLGRQVHTALEALGIAAKLNVQEPRDDQIGRRPKYRVRPVAVADCQAFADQIGFLSTRKQDTLHEGLEAVGETTRRGHALVHQALLDDLYMVSEGLPNEVRQDIKARQRSGRANIAWLEKTVAAHSQLQQSQVATLLEAGTLQFLRITEAQEVGVIETYDISVPMRNTYIANGFVSHNTISFMMDCDTTGVEPDIALVKYKRLVGGGMLKIVNQTIPQALEVLGYDPEQIAVITAFIDEKETIEGAPGFKDRHLPVFDCAFKPENGIRSIHWKGHLRMVAAVQPFLSGAVSKTVNCPEETTPAEIEKAYLEAWRMGVKAVAIYRDGSKRTAPLSTSKDIAGSKSGATEEPPRLVRERLPDERNSITHKFAVGGHKGYVIVGLYPDGRLGEIFVKMAKEGSVVSGLMDSFATATSIMLQYGVPLHVIINKFRGSRFEPAGMTGNRAIPTASSPLDYLMKWLDMKFTRTEDDAAATVSHAVLEAAEQAVAVERSTRKLTQQDREALGRGAAQTAGKPCHDCGNLMILRGGCWHCDNCFASGGCG